MKIAKIITIKKFFTSLWIFLLPFQTYDTPATRVIIPSWWGASPHLLGGRVWARRAPEARVCGPFGPDGARRGGSPTASVEDCQGSFRENRRKPGPALSCRYCSLIPA